jgi:hypothetical protein
MAILTENNGNQYEVRSGIQRFPRPHISRSMSNLETGKINSQQRAIDISLRKKMPNTQSKLLYIKGLYSAISIESRFNYAFQTAANQLRALTSTNLRIINMASKKI